MDKREIALKAHEDWKGKIETKIRCNVSNRVELSVAYTPGVAEPCKEIAKDKRKAYLYTRKWNTVAVISDGSAVLGLGNIGGLAGLPVMEGKAVLFKAFADVDAVPIVLSTQDTEEIIKTIKAIAPSFGGINLEDISAPRCFEIEERLKKELDIPVFHDDQHGTAVVTLAALINALKIVDKKIQNLKIVINGAGAAGCAISRLLLKYGVKNIILLNTKGAVCKTDENLKISLKEIASITNPNLETGNLEKVIAGADVFIGVSGPNLMTSKMVENMNKDAIVFAMSNPVPEIYPDEAKLGGARIVATGRSDFENQINNVLAFPGIFRGALDANIKVITEDIMLNCAKALADLIDEKELREDYIIVNPFDKRASAAVAKAVRNKYNKSIKLANF